jgi:DNA (cytosine-5)-methyltransferase 1
VFGVLRSRDDFLTARQIADLVTAAVPTAGGPPAGRLSAGAVLDHLRHLSRDFELEMAEGRDGPAYRLGRFRAFLGQQDHVRNRLFAAGRSTIS